MVAIRILLGKLAGQGIHLRTGLRDADPGSEPGYNTVQGPEVVAKLLWRKRNRSPNVDPFWELEAPRHDSNDRIALAVQIQALPDQFRISGESPLPQSTADHYDVISAWGFFLGQEAPPEFRLDAQDLEEARGY